MDNETCSTLTDNPDISGVGVRISFYLQTFLLVLLVNRSWQDAPLALWTFVFTNFGLTISAIAQAREHSLSFFQAVQVSNLVWLANFGTFLALASYSRRRSKDKDEPRQPRKSDEYVKFGATFQTLFTMCWTIYLWKSAATFGNESASCFEKIKYVIFVFNIPAKGAGRTVALTMSSLLLVVYSVVTLQELRSYKVPPWKTFRRRKHSEEATSGNLPLPATTPVPVEDNSLVVYSTPTPAAITTATNNFLQVPIPVHNVARPSTEQISPVSNAPSDISISGKRHGRGRRRRRWFGTDPDPMLVGIAIFQVIIFTYFIVSTELLLHRNPGAGSIGQWGFGQVFALVAVVPSALSLIKAFALYGVGRHHRKKKRRRR